MSASRNDGNTRCICGSVSFAMRCSSDCDGGVGCTTGRANSARSSSRLSGPRAVSIAVTSCPRDRNASVTRSPDASDTSRSADVPPIRTEIFKRDDLGMRF